MLARGALALAILTGGITLGAVLGAAADPEPMRAPDPPWRAEWQPPVADDARDRFALASLEPSPYRDSYAPTWAHEELTDWEPDYPEWTDSDFADEPAVAADDDPTDSEPRTETEPPEELPPEPRGEGTLDALY
jgi:hypothetical protein